MSLYCHYLNCKNNDTLGQNTILWNTGNNDTLGQNTLLWNTGNVSNDPQQAATSVTLEQPMYFTVTRGFPGFVIAAFRHFTACRRFMQKEDSVSTFPS